MCPMVNVIVKVVRRFSGIFEHGLSSFVLIFDFFHQHFCSSKHTDRVCVLLRLYLSISLSPYLRAIVDDTVFLFCFHTLIRIEQCD